MEQDVADIRQGDLRGKSVEQKLDYVIKHYVMSLEWWALVGATTDVGIKIVESIRITDTAVANLHLCRKGYEDMKVLVTSVLDKHEITETERATVLEVIQKREKDCVSKAAVAAGSVNPKYFYGDQTQVWAGALSGGVAGGVGVIMLDVIQDCYTDLKASDQTEYLRKTNQAFLEWQQWVQKRLPYDSVFNGEIAMGVARSSAGDYWLAYHSFLPHFGPVALMLSNQQSGQGTSERFHQSAKRISTKARNSLGAKVKQALTEVKMSSMRKRAAEADKKKTYRGADRVTVLGLVCEKMAERVVCARQEEEDRRVRQEVRNSPQEELGDGEGMVDDDCFPDDREVWEVTHVCE
jgi:hypothetical protein